jgi:hypothetical protein
MLIIILKKQMSFLPLDPSGPKYDGWSSREDCHVWSVNGFQPSIHPDLVKATEDESNSFKTPWFNDIPQTLPVKTTLAQALLPAANVESKVISNYNLRPNPLMKKKWV